MIKIQGKASEAICFAKIIEEEAITQIQRMCDYPLSDKIRIMPDVHAGKGCTIGTTMTITDKAVPNIVGVDIGCGMFTVNIGNEDIDFAKFDEAAHFIPSGTNVWEGRQTRYDLTQLNCYRELKDSRRIERSIGTLGAAIILLKLTAHRTERIISSFIPGAEILESKSLSIIKNLQ